MRRTTLLVVAVAAGLVMPTAVIAGHGEADCSNQHDDAVLGAGGIYVGPDGGIWEESNDKDGLQTTAEDCDSTGDGEFDATIPADTQLL